MKLQLIPKIVQGQQKFYPACKKGKEIAWTMKKRAFSSDDLEMLISCRKIEIEEIKEAG